MIKLIEYGQEVLVKREDYTDEDRVFLSKLQYENITSGECRFFIRESENGIYIKPQNYVGTIQLSKERINIFPRFDHDFKKLIYMIIFTKNVNYKAFKQNIKIEEANNDLYEIIIGFLLEEVTNILNNNIFKEYVIFNENLNTIRGGIDFSKHLTKNFLMGNNIYCKYEELNSDVIENQIILKALKMSAYVTNDSSKRKTIKRYIDIFSSLCNELRGNRVPQINYNRLNSQYIEAHYYSKLLIESIGSSSMYKGGNHNSRYSLLVDMNELFEKFVTRLFEKYIGSNYDVFPQCVISNALLDDKNKTYRKIKPDIVLKNIREANDYIIIDMKNKAYGNKNVQNEDIYQLTFYSMYFYNMFKIQSHTIIIYPKYENEIEKPENIFINTIADIKDKPFIKVCSIDINECMDLINQGIKSKRKLIDKIYKIIS